MNFPAYWARATAKEQSDERGEVRFSCWRSSDESVEDARSQAAIAAQRTARKFAEHGTIDRYGYGDVPLREERIDSWDDADGTPVAIITRNAYGCLVLNTARAMFIDLDFAAPSPSSSGGFVAFVRRLFGGAVEPVVDTREADLLSQFERFVNQHPDWSVRLYRTCNGFRALVTHTTFDPSQPTTLELLKAAGADPLYIKLCRAQQCFRARLTPKPWRCGYSSTPPRWPFESPQQQAEFDQWLASYTQEQSQYATCRYIKSLGAQTVHADIASVIDVHDRFTRANESFELA